MKTNKLILLFLIICLVTSACASGIIVADQIIPTDTKQPEFSATNTVQVQVQVNTNTPTIPAETATPTLLPTSTETPLPTIDKHPPTPTVERPVEWDLNPFYEKKIDTVWEGVRIKASILIDESLKDRVESINMMDSLLAEIVARTIFYVWYARQYPNVPWAQYVTIDSIRHYTPNTFNLREDSIDSYMINWARAQESGNFSDWRKVQINGVWANDLNDGNGYVQKPYNFWPMYEGEIQTGINSVNTVTLVYVNTSAVTNITSRKDFSDISVDVRDWGYGTNLNGDDLIIYIGYSFDPEIYLYESSPKNRLEGDSGGLLDKLGSWMVLNYGSPDYNFNLTTDNTIQNAIFKWGISLELP